MTSQWRIHHCRSDPDCDWAEPNRLYFNTPFGSLIVALDMDGSTQLWLPFKGYTHWWSPVAWHPRYA